MKDVGHVTPTGVYGEKAFGHIIESESKRSRRSGLLFKILLIYRTNTQGALVPMEPDLAKRVIAALFRNLRDTDYIGWYRDGHVLGGVLTVLAPNSEADVCSRLRVRLAESLWDHIGVEESRRLQIRVCQPHELEGGGSAISSFETASCTVLERV